ncbi:hypothetical protein [Streptomyces sp. bgisy034]|uniref:hypothetical protein n=1 Tax=Streptomyces sp. bgisy034 TaxID=3413774 RepID=UPI003EB96ECC
MTDTLKAPPLGTPPAERAPTRRVWTVATALPAPRADFGASLSDLEWTINAYNLVFACRWRPWA